MRSLIARWGQTGVPRATEAVWRSDKRRFAAWTCRVCQQKQQSHLYYSTDSERDRDQRQYENYAAFEDLHVERSQHPDVAEALISSPSDVYSRFYSERRSLPSRMPKYTRHALRKLDYRGKLPGALEYGNVDLVARCLIAANAARDEAFLSAISDDDFSKILQALGTTAESHLFRINRIQEQFSEKLREQLNLRLTDAIALEYTTILKAVYMTRSSRGLRSLTIADYAVLLRAARDLGQRDFTQLLWDHLNADGLQPDIQCWNAYMASRLGLDAYRSVSHHLTQSRSFHKVVQEQRFGLEPDHPLAGTGRLSAARKLHQQMQSDGVAADAESYALLITAAAREGDLKAMENILENVWGFDVEQPDTDAMVATEMNKSSPLYPTPQLLRAVAEAFTINRELNKALQAIDFFANRYSTPVDLTVWERLLEMAYVLALPKLGKLNRALGIWKGNLNARNIEHLWNTMIGPPYFVEPTMIMYARLIKSYYLLDLPTMMLSKMREARLVHAQDQALARNLQRAYTELMQRRQRDPATMAQASKMRDDHEYAELVRLRGHARLKQWTKLLLGLTHDSHPPWGDYRHHLCDLPRFMWDWLPFMPTFVRYETEGGMVEFDIRDHETMLASARRKQHILDAKRRKEDVDLEQQEKVSLEDALFAEFSRSVQVRPSQRYQAHTRRQDESGERR